MRLRSCESYGLLTHGLLFSYPSVQEDLETDFVVVGGGITGALIADLLMEKGMKTIVVDKRDVAQGSTAATTSLLQYEIDVTLIELQKMIGKTLADTCYQSGVKAIHDLKTLVAQRQFRSPVMSKHSVYVSRSEDGVKELKAECDARHQSGINVQWLTSKNLCEKYSLRAAGGIWSETAASVDAYQLTHWFFQHNIKRGLQVYDQSEVAEFYFQKGEHVLIFSNGCSIKCKQIIYCSGYETLQRIEEPIAKLYDTYACVSEQEINLTEAQKQTLFWDTGDPYFYMRATDDGRLLIGGGDQKQSKQGMDNSIKEEKALGLQQSFAALCPNIDYVEDHTWGGTFGTTKDGLPYIGTNRQHPQSFFALGFGGNGITFSMQARWILADYLKGLEHPLAIPYAFGR